MNRILAIDPGAKAGWAVIQQGPRDPVLVDSGIVAGDDTGLALGLLRSCGCRTVVIEDQFAGRVGGIKIGFKGLKTLIIRRARWEILAESMGYQVAAVNPANWTAHYGLRKKVIESSGVPWKTAICRMADMITGRNHLQDEADAILIGMYWAGRNF